MLTEYERKQQRRDAILALYDERQKRQGYLDGLAAVRWHYGCSDQEISMLLRLRATRYEGPRIGCVAERREAGLAR